MADIKRDCNVPRSHFDWYVLAAIMTVGLVLALGLYIFTGSSGFVTLAVPAGDLPANHLINASDLTSKTIFAFYLQDDVIRDSSYAVGNYTKIALKKDNPLTLGDISPEAPKAGEAAPEPSTIVLPAGGLILKSG